MSRRPRPEQGDDTRPDLTVVSPCLNFLRLLQNKKFSCSYGYERTGVS